MRKFRYKFNKSLVAVIIILSFIVIFEIINYSKNKLVNMSIEDKAQNVYSSDDSFGSNIDKYLDAICNNPKKAMFSSPYEYIENNKDYSRIIKEGNKALDYILIEFEYTNENGIREYIMAMACCDILKENKKNKEWSTGREWYNGYIKSLETSKQMK